MSAYNSNKLLDSSNNEVPHANGKALTAAHIDFLKSNFLSNISHEIRTPVNVIVGFTNLLTDPTYSDEQKKFFIQEINHNSKELLRIVENLLYSVKIDSKEIIPDMKMYRIGHLQDEIKSGIVGLVQKSKYRKVKLISKNETINSDQSIFTDPQKLIMAFLYLIENAIKLTADGPIVYGTEMVENTVRFFVRDAGSKINRENLVKIIDEFQKEKLSVSEENKQSGIGFTIAEKLIRALGGKLTIKSTFGKGSSFYFTIPLLVEKPV